MEIVDNSTLYDHKGNEVATAWASAIGWNHSTNERDGGIIAAAITDIVVDGTTYEMVYAWSVNSNAGGRISGWIKLSDLSPSSEIGSILTDNKELRMEIINDAGADTADYNTYTVVEAYLPTEAEEYYVDPDRDASYTAGKARYYYTGDDGYISGSMNIPETGRQRYGVAHTNIPLGDTFYHDPSVSTVSIPIYAPSSSTPYSEDLRFVWGYSLTSTGERIYSWINERALSGFTGGGNFDPSLISN